MNGIGILKNLLQTMDETAAFAWYQNCKIKRSAIKKGIELYEMAVNKYIGKELINKLEGQAFLSSKDISTHLLSDSKTGTGDWVDLAGMFAPKSEVTRLTNRIVTESISLENIQTELGLLHENYPQFSFNFAMDLLEKRTEKSIQNLEIQDIITVIEKWKHAELTFDDLVLRDAKKEFNTISRIGFGLDGDDEQKNLDFDAVRGTFENNPFVKEIQQGIKQKSDVAALLTDRLNSISK